MLQCSMYLFGFDLFDNVIIPGTIVPLIVDHRNEIGFCIWDYLLVVSWYWALNINFIWLKSWVQLFAVPFNRSAWRKICGVVLINCNLLQEQSCSKKASVSAASKQNETRVRTLPDCIEIPSDGTDVWEIDSSQLKIENKVASGSYGDL